MQRAVLPGTGSLILVWSGGLSLVDQSVLSASGRGSAAVSGPGLGMSATSNGGGAGAGHGGGGGGGESSPGPHGSGYTCYTPNLKMVSTALSSTTSTSLSACKEQCSQASGCLAVVYNRYGECHLKSAAGRVEQDDPEHHTISCKRTMDVGAVYGDLLRPATSGSGGGRGKYGSRTTLGGAGGGVINLTLTGELSLGSGASIAANGSPGNAGTRQTGGGGTTRPLSGGGGGSGGSVLVVSASVSGSGRIEATGGNGGARANHYYNYYNGYSGNFNRWGFRGGGGGGGRVAVHASSELSGEIALKATGGAPGQAGGCICRSGCSWHGVHLCGWWQPLARA